MACCYKNVDTQAQSIRTMALGHQHPPPEQQPELLINFLSRVSQQLEFLLQNREEEALEKGADFIDLAALDRQLVYKHEQKAKKKKKKQMNLSAEITTPHHHASPNQRPSVEVETVHHPPVDYSHDQVHQLASVAIHPLNQFYYSYYRETDPHQMHCSAEQRQQQQPLTEDAGYVARGGPSLLLPTYSSPMDANNYSMPPQPSSSSSSSSRLDYQTTDCAYCCWLATNSVYPTNASTIALEPICYSTTSVTYDDHNHNNSISSYNNYIHYSRWDQRPSVPH